MAEPIADSEERLVTRKRAAELLSVSPATVDRWVEARELHAIKRRGYTRIYRESIAEFEARHTTAPLRGDTTPDSAQPSHSARPPLTPRSVYAEVLDQLANERKGKT